MKYFSPKILYIPYKRFAPQTPLKKLKVPRTEIPSKGHPTACTLVEFKEHFKISFSHYANIVGPPLFRSVRQAQNTDTHVLNQPGMSQNSSPL